MAIPSKFPTRAHDRVENFSFFFLMDWWGREGRLGETKTNDGVEGQFGCTINGVENVGTWERKLCGKLKEQLKPECMVDKAQGD